MQTLQGVSLLLDLDALNMRMIIGGPFFHAQCNHVLPDGLCKSYTVGHVTKAGRVTSARDRIFVGQYLHIRNRVLES